MNEQICVTIFINSFLYLYKKSFFYEALIKFDIYFRKVFMN